MVDVALVGGDVAARWVLAVAVSCLDRAAQHPGEGSLLGHGEHGGRPVEQDRLHQGVVEVAGELFGADHGAAAELAQVLSPLKNFESFTKGMLDSYNLICMLLMVIVFLVLTIRRLDAARLNG